MTLELTRGMCIDLWTVVKYQTQPGFQTMLNPTHIYTVKKGCENRIFGFPQKYHVKTTQDTTQVTFRAFQAKLGSVNF